MTRLAPESGDLWNALVTRLRQETFRRDPAQLHSRGFAVAYNAACSVAMADGDAEQKARLRALALAWLRADLEVEHKNLVAALDWSFRDTDLASVRDEQALAELPEAEAARWRAHWAERRKLLESLREKR